MNMHMCTCSYMYIIYNVGVSLIRGGTIDLAEVTVSSTLHHMLESNSQLEWCKTLIGRLILPLVDPLFVINISYLNRQVTIRS